MKQNIYRLGLTTLMAFSLIGTGCVAPNAKDDSASREPVAKTQSEEKSSSASVERSEEKKSDEKKDESKAEKKSEAAASISTLPEEEKEPEPNYEELYRPVLEDMVAAAQTRDSTKAMGMTGVVEYADPMNEVGYTIMDVSGDGIPELIVAPTSPEESSVVLSLYTLANGAPQFVLEGFARSRYVYHGENHFTYGASGGMNISGCGEFTLSEDGTAPVWSRFLFTDPNPVDGMFVFSNTTGSWDIASSEPYSDNLDDYVAVSSELANIPVVGLNVTPFSNYR